MSHGLYILNENGEPVTEPDTLKWARWFETHDRHVAYDECSRPKKVRISTVFLGIDHSFGGEKPVLWETMIFGGPHDQYQKRYTSIEDARRGHARAVKLAKE